MYFKILHFNFINQIKKIKKRAREKKIQLKLFDTAVMLKYRQGHWSGMNR